MDCTDPGRGHPLFVPIFVPLARQILPKNKTILIWYNPPMNALDTKIIAALTGPDPPVTVLELAKRCDSSLAYTHNRIWFLIRQHKLEPHHCPWRHDHRAVRQKRKIPGPLSDIATQLEAIINENGSDRVSALRELRDLRTAGGYLSGPPVPNDRPSTVFALARVIRAAGRDALNEAITLVWPPNAQESTEADLEGSPPGGDHLD